jgi:hypothetical protein
MLAAVPIETKPASPAFDPDPAVVPFSVRLVFASMSAAPAAVDPNADTEEEDNDPDFVERLAPNDMFVSMLGRVCEQAKRPLK